MNLDPGGLIAWLVVGCALRGIRTAGTAEKERSVRREAYGGFGDAERCGERDAV
jgi:hypothetical protein